MKAETIIRIINVVLVIISIAAGIFVLVHGGDATITR